MWMKTVWTKLQILSTNKTRETKQLMWVIKKWMQEFYTQLDQKSSVMVAYLNFCYSYALYLWFKLKKEFFDFWKTNPNKLDLPNAWVGEFAVENKNIFWVHRWKRKFQDRNWFGLQSTPPLQQPILSDSLVHPPPLLLPRFFSISQLC